jgi:2-polyprenyl-6-hydroxyphenyl methylase / 3-demethylubiquinone-9 3-methyltransferase
MAVDNNVYSKVGCNWWDESEGVFATLRFFINPVRFNYFLHLLQHEKDSGRILSTVLDVGCGGGFLAEEFTRAGFKVTGIDPMEQSIEAAREHARGGGLNIDYRIASGEHLPFPDETFDIVLCCDVLEHVDNIDQVVAEISRVLKFGGLFCYDTINRTFASKIAVIKVMQEWPSTACVPPNAHDWNKFIKPMELSGLISRKGLTQRGIRGISVRGNPIAIWLNFRRRAQGMITYRELGRRLEFYESSDTSTTYMGYAIKGTDSKF